MGLAICSCVCSSIALFLLCAMCLCRLDLWLPGPPYEEEAGELLTVSTCSHVTHLLYVHKQCFIRCGTGKTDCCLWQVSVNLQALASEYCPTMNIEEEMKKQILPSPPHSPAHGFRCVHVTVNGMTLPQVSLVLPTYLPRCTYPFAEMCLL